MSISEKANRELLLECIIKNKYADTFHLILSQVDDEEAYNFYLEDSKFHCVVDQAVEEALKLK